MPDRLPSVIAIPLEEYLRETHQVLRLHRLCDAMEVLSKFLTVVALGEVRRQFQGQPLPDDLLKVLQPQIERPTFGQWLAMLLALIDSVVWEKAVLGPAFPRFVKNHLEPGFWGPQGLVKFRNDLFHGGGIPQAWAREQLTGWDPWLADLLPHLGFLAEAQVCYVSQGKALRLVGPALAGEEMALSPHLARELQELNEHVVLVQEEAWLDLWPLCDYGRATQATLEGLREATSASPLVFFRAERQRCLYAALGSDLPHGERTDVLQEFLALFRLRERQPAAGQALDFEEELRSDAGSLIGREQEVRQAKEILKGAQHGVFWLSGPGGIGKSFILARLAGDLRLPSSRGCRIAWRFKLSDEVRGNRTAFLRHVYGRLAKWIKKKEQTPSPDPARLFDQVRGLLDEVGKLPPPKPGGRPSRVLFFVDGLDEIARLDESFLELPFLLSRKNVVWVCAGRPEGQLPRVFSQDRCTHLFPQGLPAMTDADIRALLLESTWSRKYDLLALDREEDGKVKNPAVEAVVQRAQGLPLYVHYVIEDISSGHYRFADLPQRLPPSLSDYYDDLLRRLSIGDLQALLTPLVVTLAWAHAPLDEGMLLFLMRRRRVLFDDEESQELLRQGLEAIASMVRLAPLPRAEGFGYEPYHPTFREHLRQDQAKKLGQQNRLAQEEFVALARSWVDVPEACRLYALAHGPKILREAGRWDDLEKLLTDLRFIEAKCAAGLTYDLMADYNLALRSLPEAQPEIQKEQKHQTRVQKYVDDMIAYARAWNEARDRYAEDPVKYPMPTAGDIPLPEIIPVADLRSAEQIKAETERITNKSTRLDHTRAFAQFVNAEGHALVKFANTHPGFCLQQAWNSAQDGPVAQAAAALVREESSQVLLLDHPAQRLPYQPQPALLRTLEGYTDSIRCVALTPDGRRALSGGGEETLRLWDLNTGACLQTLEGHTDGVNSVAITPDGRRALSGGGDGTLRLWDLDTGACLQTLEGHTRGILSVALTEDGRRALSSEGWNSWENSTLRLWDLDTGACLLTLEGHTHKFGSVALTPDGRRALSGGRDNALRLWDLDTGACLRTLRGQKYGVYSVVLTPDGRRALSATFDGTLQLWDLDTNVCLQTLEKHFDYDNSVALTPDGRRALSGGDKNLRLWDLDTGACLQTLKGHFDKINSVALTPDGRRALSGSKDRTLRLWDLDTGACLQTPEGHTNPVSFESVVALTPDGHRALSGGYDETLRLWDFDTGTCLRGLKGHTQPIKSVALTPDGHRALSGSWDETLRLWDLDTNVCLRVMEGPTRGILSVALTPDGRRALSATFDGTLELWDLDTNVCLQTLEKHFDYDNSVALTPDGRRAFSGSRDQNLRLWDLDTGARLRILEGHTHSVDSVALTPDGRRALSASADETLRLWDLGSGVCLKTLEWHSGSIKSVAITPDGHRALSGSWDETLRLWDIDTGVTLAVYQARKEVTSLSAIRANGHFVLGTIVGEVIFLQPLNFPMQPPLVTPVRLWLPGLKARPGHWDRSITISCPWCGQRFPVPKHLLKVIQALNQEAGLGPDDSPCLSLPGEAWEEPRLLSQCPQCHKPLKFNPFIVDNRDRY